MEIATRTQSFVVVVALVSGVVAPAWAAATPATVGSSIDDEKQARSLYERAEKSFDLGRFAEALADYQSAYEAKPLPGFLFNIAQCYRNMSNFERARFFFRRYLTLDPRAPNRRRVEELIAEMSKQLDAHAAEAAAPPPSSPNRWRRHLCRWPLRPSSLPSRRPRRHSWRRRRRRRLDGPSGSAGGSGRAWARSSWAASSRASCFLVPRRARPARSSRSTRASARLRRALEPEREAVGAALDDERRGRRARAARHPLLERGEPRRRHGLAVETEQHVALVERAARDRKS